MKVELNNVTKKIRGSTVLHQVDLTMESGTVYGLWGSNGSGKTMLLRVISGLIYPTSGTAKVDGKRLGREIDFPDSLGLLLENPAFLDEYTGLKNLELIAAINRRASHDELVETLRRVGLDPEDKRTYHKYSLGMKQRLGLAAALMEHPDLLLLDEPTNALDVDGVALLEKLIQEEKARGALIVIASHDRHFLTAVSDEIYLVRQGLLTKEAAE
jgi:ABC-2 type transport system ATP-binding protein